MKACRKIKNSPWDPDETEEFIRMCEKHKYGWKVIAHEFSLITGKTYSGNQCMNRWKQLNIKKGSWTKEEDEILKECVARSGDEIKWPEIAKNIPGRNSKQCRERWKTGIEPSIDKSEFKEYEDRLILEERLKNKGWSIIASMMPGRVDNTIKNRWNTQILPAVRKLHPENLDVYGENDIPEIIELMKSSKTPNRKTPKRVLRDLTNQPESELPSQTKKRNRDSSEIGYQSPQPTKIRPLYDTPQPFGDYNDIFDFPDSNQNIAPGSISLYSLPPSPLTPLFQDTQTLQSIINDL